MQLSSPFKSWSGVERSVFEKDLELETLKNERLRLTIVGSLCLAFAVLAPLASLVFPEAYQRLFNGKIPRLTIVVIFGGLALYEFIARFAIGIIIQKDKRLLTLPRYINALVETTIPSVIIVILTDAWGPMVNLFGPPTLLYLLFIFTSALRLSSPVCIFSGVSAAIQYFILVNYYSAGVGPGILPIALTGLPVHIGKTMIIFGSGVLTGYITNHLKNRLVHSLSMVAEKNQVISMFGQHVSPQVVEQLLKQEVEMSSETRNVCVMFLDIRNFTSFSEDKQPQEVVSFLNSLFTFMIDIINRHHGIINKFLGDGFMAVFGAPFTDGEDSKNAVAASLEILAELNKRNKNGEFSDTRIGIGLHSGPAVTGHVGSAERKEYTVIGDVVNLASRIESLNKQFEAQLLVSADVYARLGDMKVQGQSLGPVTVKGKAKEVEVYKLV